MTSKHRPTCGIENWSAKSPGGWKKAGPQGPLGSALGVSPALLVVTVHEDRGLPVRLSLSQRRSEMRV